MKALPERGCGVRGGQPAGEAGGRARCSLVDGSRRPRTAPVEGPMKRGEALPLGLRSMRGTRPPVDGSGTWGNLIVTDGAPVPGETGRDRMEKNPNVYERLRPTG